MKVKPIQITQWLSTITGGSCHKYHFCRDKQVFIATNRCLSRQNMSFVATKVCLSGQNFCRDKHIFVATNVLPLQAYFCPDKHVFVATKHVFCRDKSMLVATKMILVAARASDSLQWGPPERQELCRPNTRYAAITDTTGFGNETKHCT